jgi:hypothetical protein
MVVQTFLGTKAEPKLVIEKEMMHGMNEAKRCQSATRISEALTFKDTGTPLLVVRMHNYRR